MCNQWATPLFLPSAMNDGVSKNDIQPMNKAFKGRATSLKPVGRFDRQIYTDVQETDFQSGIDQQTNVTKVFADQTRSIIATNESSDVGFSQSVNPYRGCEHGCIYCYARPTHEYLGLNSGIDFESRIFVKQDAATLLEKKFESTGYRPDVLAFSGVTDCYQPLEKSRKITRELVTVCVRYKNPVAIVTKNYLVTRDIDLLVQLAKINGCFVYVTLSTLDEQLVRTLEPRASSAQRRLEAIEKLARAKIPVGVMIAPVIAGLTDQHIPAVLQAAAARGARWANWLLLRLPHSTKELFSDWLEQHMPDRRQKVLELIKQTRNGKLNDPAFFSRYRGHGPYAAMIARLFSLHAQRLQLCTRRPGLSSQHFCPPREAHQMQLPL